MTNEELVIKIKAGIDVSENMLQLYNQVERFIGSIAKRYQAYEDIDDLKQEGYLSLYDAIDGYDPDTGNKFLTYASWHIRRQMQHYIIDRGSCLRLPFGKNEKVQQYNKLCNQYMLECGRKPTDQEAAYHLDLSIAQVRDIKNLSVISKLGSLDASVTGLDGGEDTAVVDMVADLKAPQDEVSDQVQQEQLKNEIWVHVDSLAGRQPDVIRKRYIENKTLQEIADEHGVTRELIRQDEVKGLRELRKPKNSRWLMPYFEDIRSSAMIGVGAEHFRRTWTSATEYTVFKLLEGRIK